MGKWDCVWAGIHGLGVCESNEVRTGEDVRKGMAGLEECEGKLLLTLYRLKRMKKENPRICEKLAVLEKNVEDELLQLGCTMEQDEVADCTNKEEEAVIVDDVANMIMMEDELEIDQVGPGSYDLQTWMDEGTLMEEPHDDDDDDVSTMDTCVSFEHFVDGPYAGKSKASLSMLGSILPWMSMMRPCMEKQGLLIVAGLVGVVCDLMVEGTKARDKGGT